MAGLIYFLSCHYKIKMFFFVISSSWDLMALINQIMIIGSNNSDCKPKPVLQPWGRFRAGKALENIWVAYEISTWLQGIDIKETLQPFERTLLIPPSFSSQFQPVRFHDQSLSSPQTIRESPTTLRWHQDPIPHRVFGWWLDGGTGVKQRSFSPAEP